MGLRQQFSTTIYSWNGTLSAEVLFLPRSDMAIPDSDDPQYLESVMNTLGPEYLAPVQAQNLEQGLAAFLVASSDGNRELSRALEGAGHRPISLDAPGFLEPGRVSLEYKDFAKELLSSSRIPIEESPLSGVPLGELFSKASKASPTTLGALIGWVIAGNTPLLLLLVPAGIILVRSAVGIGKGLEEGLHSRVKKLFTPAPARKR